MRKENFIPGEIYITDNTFLKYYYIGPNSVLPDQGIFQHTHTGKIISFLYESNTYEWKEYGEPRKGTRWMSVYSGADGNIFTATWETKEQADRYRYFSATRIACIEVPWVEGQGL